MKKHTVALLVACAAVLGGPMLHASFDSAASAQPANPVWGANAPAPAPTSGAYQTISYTLQAIRDVTMGGVVSHTVLVPAGWTLQGQTQWSTGQLVLPNVTLSVASTDGASVAFIPRISTGYLTVGEQLNRDRMAIGLPPMEPTGTPPPHDIGQFIVDYIQQSTGQQVRLVEQRTDDAMQNYLNAMRQEGLSGPVQGREAHLKLTLEFDHNGVTMRQDLSLSYQQSPTVDFGAGTQTYWGIEFGAILTAPKATFDAKRPMLNAIARSVQPTAKWWVQRDAAISDIQNARHRAAMQQISDFGDYIRSRAAEYERMSDAQHAAFVKRMGGEDRNHRRFLDTIMDVTTFKGADGSTRQFPGGTGRAFSNGQGGFMSSNDPNFQPPAGFTPMEPAG